MFFWLLLFGIVTGVIAKNIGVPQQFLVPEYMGGTGIISFGILGVSVGGFITGFNLYSYIMHGYRFPFIATLSKPFHKFSINNFLIPGIFMVTYIVCSAQFQLTKELIEPVKVFMNLVSFVTGIFIFQTLSYLYFTFTNKDAQAFGKGRKRKQDAPIDSPLQPSQKWYKLRKLQNKWHVETYMSSVTRVSLARESQHYSREVLEKVFFQNHINASRFEIVLIISFLLIGSLRSLPYFVIPAGASALLFFTMLLMLTSALHSWLKGWTLSVFILFMVLFNYLYTDLRLVLMETRAYGLDYSAPKAEYDLNKLRPTADVVAADKNHTLNILENWKAKVSADLPDGVKPKMIILNHSGGGTRSAYWTMCSLQYADSICNGDLLNNCMMMTGASGGMLGAAYLREIMLRNQQGESYSIGDQKLSNKIGKDLLNPILFSAVTNDWFIRYQKFDDGPYSYTKDRASAFEDQLKRNTDYLFDKRLGDYSQPEYEAKIPMMILSPTVVNDGRRLVIASQPVSYLTQAYQLNGDPNPFPEDLEFSRMFEAHNAMNLQFTSALRMNATFPYVLPITTLPSTPPLEVLDAGVRDNFGLKTTLQFLDTFKAWIESNTSGVIIVQVRDLPKNKVLEEHKQSLFGNFSAPIGGIYSNITKTQDYSQEQMLRYLKESFSKNIDLITFELHQDKETHISLSWHLTKSEKNQIIDAKYDTYFQSEMYRLKALLEAR